MSHYIIVDLEATCEVEQTDQYLSEIIEIGACLATEDGEIVSEFQTFIRPVINPLLSEMCKTLTSISQPDVDSAPPYHEAIAAFDNWVMDSAATFSVTGWCSWGGYDKRQFVRNAALFEAASPHL
ncbi:MAG: 3'-5' exonuclease, partial [Hafnia sp.]